MDTHMQPESQVKALLVVLSAMFESLEPEVRARTITLIEDSYGFVDDPDARRLMATYGLEPCFVVPVKRKKKRKSRK